MTFKKVNLMPPLKMRRITDQQSKGPQNTPMNSDPKSFKNSHEGQVKNNEITSKTRKGKGSNETKKKAFMQNIERRYQKPPRHPLILRAHLHAKYLCLKPLTKEEEVKATKPNGTPRIFMPYRGNKI
jgi:hypothetical protein